MPVKTNGSEKSNLIAQHRFDENPVVVVGIARTPLGAMQGSLASLAAVDLGVAAVSSALDRARVHPRDVDQLLFGCVLPAGLGQAPARQVALRSGLPSSTVTSTINKVCGSGMKTVMMAADALLLDRAKVVVAGGMESMSNAPYLMPHARRGYRMGHGDPLLDHMFTDGLEDAGEGRLMGCFADATAAKYACSREAQDQFAINSLTKACDAMKSGIFADEIAPVIISGRKGDSIVSEDELPQTAQPHKIPHLKPAFSQEGTVTAANASSIADGAAALVLTRENYAKEKGWPVMAKLRGQAEFAQEPEWFTTAPSSAIRNLLVNIGWQTEEVDLFEINEAFAVVALAALADLSIPADKVNVHGGACALGHPLGASGARILVTLISAMQRYDKPRGVASLCIGGGEATALAFERPTNAAL